MPLTLRDLETSELLIRELYVDLRERINKWAELTKQTAQARMGYVGQHLVSIATGYPGSRTGARGKDLVISSTEYGEIKTCYRVDQLGKCNNCRAAVAAIETECPSCKSKDIKRNDDSKWLISIRHDEEFANLLEPKSYYLVLFDFTDMANPTTIRASIYEVDPRTKGFAFCMIDYYYNIKANSSSGAPFNLWPFQLKFHLMQPSTIYQSFIEKDGAINTKIFPGRDKAVLFEVEAFDVYSQANLSRESITALAKFIGYADPLPSNKRAALTALHAFRVKAGLSNKVVAESMADALYSGAIAPHLKKLPAKLATALKSSGLVK
jgi:hypothetical protein